MLKYHIFLVCKSHGDLHTVFLCSVLQYNEKLEENAEIPPNKMTRHTSSSSNNGAKSSFKK
jgi:hypothetical protein